MRCAAPRGLPTKIRAQHEGKLSLEVARKCPGTSAAKLAPVVHLIFDTIAQDGGMIWCVVRC